MMSAPMPSPLGHSLAGLAVGWFSDPVPAGPTRSRLAGALTPLVFWCGFVAAIPDADLLVPHFHRSATHSVAATAFILIITAAVTGKVTGQTNWRMAVAFAAAHASHLLLDWLGMDRFPPPGIQLLWPFSDHFFISGIDLFPPVERRLLRPEALAINARAAMWELLFVGPVALVAWRVRRRWRSSRRPVALPAAETRRR
jgi:membrane-bound metal-dependent hydrolase YbcI (DUF457 family)